MSTPLVAFRDHLLGEIFRVTLSDGRVLQGRLHCLDWKQNILLRDAVEGGKRPLGLVAVEARYVVKYECTSSALRGLGAECPMLGAS